MILHRPDRRLTPPWMKPKELAAQGVRLGLIVPLPYAEPTAGDCDQFGHGEFRAASSASRRLGFGRRLCHGPSWYRRPGHIDEYRAFDLHGLSVPVEPHPLGPGGRKASASGRQNGFGLEARQVDPAISNASSEIDVQCRSDGPKTLKPRTLDKSEVKRRKTCIEPFLAGWHTSMPDLAPDPSDALRHLELVDQGFVAPGKHGDPQRERLDGQIIQTGGFRVEGRCHGSPTALGAMQGTRQEIKPARRGNNDRDWTRDRGRLGTGWNACKLDPTNNDPMAEINLQSAPRRLKALLHVEHKPVVWVRGVRGSRHRSSKMARAYRVNLIFGELRLGNADGLYQPRVAPSQERVAEGKPLISCRPRHLTTPTCFSQVNQAWAIGATTMRSAGRADRAP